MVSTSFFYINIRIVYTYINIKEIACQPILTYDFYTFSYSSCNAARYPRILSFCLPGRLRNPSRIIFSSVFTARSSKSTALGSVSFSPRSSYGVTFSTSQIFSILSADGFVPFLFQSLISVSALLQTEAKAQSLPSLKAWAALFVLSQ